MTSSIHLAFKAIKGDWTNLPACSVTRPGFLTTQDEREVTCLRCRAYMRRRNKLGGGPEGVSPDQRLQNQLSSARQRLRAAWERLLNAHRAGHDSESVSRDLAAGDVRSICGLGDGLDSDWDRQVHQQKDR